MFLPTFFIFSTLLSTALGAALLPRSTIGMSQDFSLYKKSVDISARKVAEIFVTQLQDLGKTTYKDAVYPSTVTIKSVRQEAVFKSWGGRKQEDWATGTAEFKLGTPLPGLMEQFVIMFEEQIKKSIRENAPTQKPVQTKEKKCKKGPPYCDDTIIGPFEIEW